MADSEDRSRHEEGPPDCSRYCDQVSRIKQIINASRAVCDLRRYLTDESFARSGRLIDHEHPDEFTNQDFKAINTLNVSLLLSARAWLRGAGLKTVRKYLRTIPKDLDIWRVEPEKYAGLLGRKSKAWKLWEILADLQRKGRARRAGVGVTAGKALHGKRSRLIPVYDREGIGRIPGVTQRNIREVMWCALRDTDIRERLEQLRAEVPEAPSCHSFGSSISSSGWRSDRSLARSSTTPTSVIRHCGLPGSRQRASPEPPAPFASHPG